MMLHAYILILRRLNVWSVSELQPCSVAMLCFKEDAHYSVARPFFVVVPAPRECQPFSWLKTGIAPTQMPVHRRPAQVVFSSILWLNFSFLWPPCSQKSWLRPVVKHLLRACVGEVCLNYERSSAGR